VEVLDRSGKGVEASKDGRQTQIPRAGGLHHPEHGRLGYSSLFIWVDEASIAWRRHHVARPCVPTQDERRAEQGPDIQAQPVVWLRDDGETRPCRQQQAPWVPCTNLLPLADGWHHTAFGRGFSSISAPLVLLPSLRIFICTCTCTCTRACSDWCLARLGDMRFEVWCLNLGRPYI